MTQDLIKRLRMGASISRERNLNIDMAKIAEEAADARRNREPHIAGEAFCLACGHNWHAVWPMGVTELECPECKRMTGRSTYEVSPHPDSRVYECRCGNQLFHVLDDRIHCPNCGQQTGCGDIPWSVK